MDASIVTESPRLPRRPLVVAVRTLLALTVMVAVAAPLRATPPPSLPEMLEDAELNDIHFADPARGWAVGDRGVIWHTSDGGRTWRLQDCPVSCRLDSIDFVDADHGWIVGGWIHPYTHKSTGVVLHTRDGGRRWAVYSQLTLPALKRVRFLDARRGWAVGHASALHGSGVYRTEDGGRSWAAVPGGKSEGWLAADFRDPQSGVVAGRTGKLGLVALNRLKPSQTPDLGIRHLRDMKLVGPTGGWLVGDGGLLLQTIDGGFTWQAPSSRLPAGLAEHFDFRTVATWRHHCWVAGSPGTRVFHSADGGHTWDVLTTGQPVPLNSLHFVDDRRGWACGRLGTILVTEDGGRSWQRQRTGGTRAALLGIFSEPERLPLEMLAQLAGDEGYLVQIEILNRRDLELPPETETSRDERTHQAVVATGGSGARTAWRFPLRQEGVGWSAASIVAGWDLFSDGRGSSLLEAHLVRTIRQWRPEVIVTEAATAQGNRPLAHLTNQFVLAAVQKAAEPTAYADQITLGGLQPWSVKKVFSHEVGDRGATVELNPQQLATRLGQSLADQAAYGYGLLRREYMPTAERHGFRLLINRLPQALGERDIFHGIALQSGGEARRLQSSSSATNLAELTRRAQKSRNVRQLLDREQNGMSDQVWLSQIEDLTGGLNASLGGQILFQLAERYRRRGQPHLAAEAFERLLVQYPDHPLAEHALLWTVQYYASREAGWRLRRPNQFRSRELAVQPASPSPIQRATFNAPLDTPMPRVSADVAGRTGTINPGEQTGDRAGKAVQLGKLVESRRPSLFAEPRLRFPLASAYRALGMPREAERFYHGLASLPEPTSWSRCAAAELWLGQAQGIPPKPVAKCVRGVTRPRLDGRLDDMTWQNVKPLELHPPEPAEGPPPATVKLAGDDEFLYLAITCRKTEGIDYRFDKLPRPRDADLSGRDRVDVLLDVDRDYSTYYRLTVDHRGWTGEACLGDASWDPEWFVAAAESETEWTVEAAIAWSELVPQAPGSRHAWAFGLQRIVPGTGVQAFSRPAAPVPRAEGFGLLVFE